jgi:hypothetical protein
MALNRLADVAAPSFARHETFAPRFGWLHKAYVAVKDDETVFLDKSAPVTLGVGKNMVNAIRYWAQAFNLTVEYPIGGTSRAMAAAPTWEAYWLLDEDGADPYLEDPASLWLLHWWLLSPETLAPTWWVAFHSLPTGRFTEAELSDLVTRQVRLSGWEPPVSSSVVKDVDCLTKMYAPRKANPGSPGSFEDLLDCPFRELGLLESLEAMTGGRRTWRFTSTARSTLPPAIAAYACLDYAAQTAANEDGSVASGGSISMARLASEPGSPGRAFRIREPALAQLVEEACQAHRELKLTTVVGRRSLVYPRNLRELAWNILNSHYGNLRQRPGFQTRAEWTADHPGLLQAKGRGKISTVRATGEAEVA